MRAANDGPLFPSPQRLAKLVLEDDATGVEFVANAVGLGEVLRLAGGGAFGDRKSDVKGKSVSVRVDPGGRGISKKKNISRHSVTFRLVLYDYVLNPEQH